eukprot:m51a1_g2448 putative threonine synthase (569) ;mRNA; r:884893-887030
MLSCALFVFFALCCASTYKGALGVFISGSGPTVLALCRGASTETCERLAADIKSVFASHGLGSRAHLLGVDEGAFTSYERACEGLRRASYISTRDCSSRAPSASFSQVVLGGMPADGGLFVPSAIPALTAAELSSWASLEFNELVVQVLSRFSSSDDVTVEELRAIARKSFSTFPEDPLPLTAAGTPEWLLVGELFHGPTHSFKDVALQFLGHLMQLLIEKERARGGAGRMTILGATSGDTGSAAIQGFRGKDGIEVFMLHPHQRVSEIQRRQMLSVKDSNVHNLAVRGSFDDCQRIVKELFGNAEFKAKHALGAVNSINWARIALQISYYFYFFFKARRMGHSGKISFCVPSGNFGDALSGYYAKRMGLPIDKIVVATNENNILHTFFATGVYARASESRITPSPSMDIQVSSNFERYLYYLSGEDHQVLAGWMKQFSATGSIALSPELLAKTKEDFLSGDATNSETYAAMTSTWHTSHLVVCPHTAVGIHVAHEQRVNALSQDTVICLATAHPAKFPEASQQAGTPLASAPPARGIAAVESLDPASLDCPLVDPSAAAVSAFMERQ